MGEQQVFVERRCRSIGRRAGHHRQSHASQLGKRRPAFAGKGQRHQRRPRLDYAQAKLARQLVAEIAGADLRNRQAAGGDDQFVGAQDACLRMHFVAAMRVADTATAVAAPRGFPMHDRIDLARAQPLHAAGFAFTAQQFDDALRRVIAKQLAAMLFVITDAMLAQQPDEARRRVGAQGITREARLFADETIGPIGAQIGEVATATARDADLLGQAREMVEHGHAQAALPRHRCAEQSGRAGSDHDGVEWAVHGRGRL